MRNPEAKHLVLHPALRLRRQFNRLHVEGSAREVELERVLKAHNGSALWGLGGSGRIQLNTATDGDFVGRGRACPRRIGRIRAEERGRRSINENLSRIEIGRFHHGFNRACYRGISGKGIAAGGACSRSEEHTSELQSLLDGGVNVEGPSKPDDAEQ